MLEPRPLMLRLSWASISLLLLTALAMGGFKTWRQLGTFSDAVTSAVQADPQPEE